MSDSIYDWARREVAEVEQRWGRPLDLRHLSALAVVISEIVDDECQSAANILDAIRFAAPESTESASGNQTPVDAQKCVWDRAWVGPCNVESDQRLCVKHRGQKCTDCDNEAVGECESAGQFVCGYPLCEDHRGLCSSHRRKR
jgi:hypothetical protein